MCTAQGGTPHEHDILCYCCALGRSGAAQGNQQQFGGNFGDALGYQTTTYGVRHHGRSSQPWE